MTVLGALALARGVRFVPLFPNQCPSSKHGGREKQKEGSSGAKEWREMGVCLRGVGRCVRREEFIGRCRAGIFPLSS